MGVVCRQILDIGPGWGLTYFCEGFFLLEGWVGLVRVPEKGEGVANRVVCLGRIKNKKHAT